MANHSNILPGISHGQRSLVGYNPWHWKELDMTEQLRIDLSVHFSRSVVSDSLWPHESQHTRPPCPSPAPGVHSDSRLSSRWCYPAISSLVVPFSSCLQSLPASVFSNESTLAWGGQSTGVSALASFLPKNTQDWCPLGWTGWTSLQSKNSQESSPTHSSNASVLQRLAFFTVQLSHPYMTTGKTIALTRRTCVGKVMSLLLNMLSRLVITFLPRSKCLWISWCKTELLQFHSLVTSLLTVFLITVNNVVLGVQDKFLYTIFDSPCFLESKS